MLECHFPFTPFQSIIFDVSHNRSQTDSHLSILKTKQTPNLPYNFNCLTPPCLLWASDEREITSHGSDRSVWKTNCKTLHHLNIDWMPIMSIWERVRYCTSHMQFPPWAIIATTIALKCFVFYRARFERVILRFWTSSLRQLSNSVIISSYFAVHLMFLWWYMVKLSTYSS